MLPWAASPQPIPAAMMRKVPQKKESPIPAMGPIRAAFKAAMDSMSNWSPDFLFSSSMAMHAPVMKVTS